MSDRAWCTQTLPRGSTTYSANAPSRFTPRLTVRMHRWRRPARQLRQVPQTMWPSPDTKSPTATSRDAGADLHHLAENSCPGPAAA